MARYDHKAVEKKWQEKWESDGIYNADDLSKKPKEYVLDMFPYPSGSGLHAGHVEGYTATDISARFARMQGKEVLHPIGWDAFGLPAENFAIKTKTPPRESTDKAINTFRRQIKSLGLSYDWSREIGTHTPEYYRWTQWFFLMLYKHGLAYRKKAKVNWCSSCQTVLANEQVVDGACERCGTEVKQKDLEQWFFKTTAYAEELLSGLDNIDWPESTKIAQRNWIGKSEGAEIEFALDGRDEKIKVFTTRPDTLFGATYLVLAPEHPLVETLASDAKNEKEVREYVKTTSNKTDMERNVEGREKTGVELKGINAINPANNEALPIFLADYVFGSYGTGAIMAVPAHDERDFEFAEKFGLQVRQVIAPFLYTNEGKDAVRDDKETVRRKTAYVLLKHWNQDKYLCLDWKKFGWHSGIIGGIKEGETAEEAAIREILEETGYLSPELVKNYGVIHNSFFAQHKDVNRYAEGVNMVFKLRNGEKRDAIPEETIHHDAIWVDTENMQDFLNLPNFDFFWNQIQTGDICYTGAGVIINSGDFTGTDSNEAKRAITEMVGGKMVTTYRLRDWLVSRQRYWGAPIPIIYCEKCGTVPVPEEDLPVLLPEDVDFMPTGESPLVHSKSFHDVSCPLCGKPARRESDTMDTFVCSSWYYYRFTDPNNDNAFASESSIKKWMPVNLYLGGAEHTVLHLLYARFFTKVLHAFGYTEFDEPFLKLRHQGMILAEDGRKMSKSLGNVINPDDVVREYGADTLRLYEMFMGPIDVQKPWSTKNIKGAYRFVDRVYKLLSSRNKKEEDSFAPVLHETIKKVGEDIKELKFNTAISQLMICLNKMEYGVSDESLKIFARLLAPFAPHLAEEVWHELGENNSVHKSTWPKYDKALLATSAVKIVVQVNGKRRGEMELAPNVSEEEALAGARAISSVAEAVANKEPKRVIYVQGRILNIVI
ncbi:Leucyl-tRNA synthetase [hydrothermal vent metagenome]|uniref:leucine--tRNA ligase n=1 Tax=hydrothermal vent metagenome TaxID=652676 RepID=A0A3B0V2L5_9ZZZZ